MSDDQCKGRYLFNITYSPDLIDAFQEMLIVSFDIYTNIIVFFSPINILANLFSALILMLTKELRNPYNLILCIMCLATIVPLFIRASLIYRKVAVPVECSPEMFSDSIALHSVVEFNSWAPFRALYTWLAAFLTLLRFRALHSKGKWEASYLLVFVVSAIVAVLSAAAGVPLYMTNSMGTYRLGDLCEASDSTKDTLVWYPQYSSSLLDNDCLLYRLNQWISGIFHNTLPSLVLLASTLLLTCELSRARKDHAAVAGKSAKKNDDGLRAARMLTVVAILTLLSELPQGFASLANAVFPVGFQNNYTEKFLMIWATIQLLTTSCNLLITLAMSKAVKGVLCFWRKKEPASRTAVSVTSLLSVKSVNASRF